MTRQVPVGSFAAVVAPQIAPDHMSTAGDQVKCYSHEMPIAVRGVIGVGSEMPV